MAAAAFLRNATKLVTSHFTSHGLSKGSRIIRCGKRDQLVDVDCGHDDGDDVDSDT
jgi:hypothetical protein